MAQSALVIIVNIIFLPIIEEKVLPMSRYFPPCFEENIETESMCKIGENHVISINFLIRGALNPSIDPGHVFAMIDYSFTTGMQVKSFLCQDNERQRLFYLFYDGDLPPFAARESTTIFNHFYIIAKLTLMTALLGAILMLAFVLPSRIEMNPNMVLNMNINATGQETRISWQNPPSSTDCL